MSGMNGATGASASTPDDKPLLAVRDLRVAFSQRGQWVDVLDGVSLDLWPGETVGLVGESGSGKTVTALSIMGLVGGSGGRLLGGSIRLGARELVGGSEKEWQAIRGRRISMIFQQPTRALNPAFTVGAQIAEVARRQLGLSRSAAQTRAVELLERVGIPEASERARAYPHMLSGGMCQRVMIAMAIAGNPEVLIADEPTTALDVTVQARVLDLLREVQQETNVAMLFVSHDLGVIAQMCDRVNVFYCGQVVEHGSLDSVLDCPKHPYTAGLLGAVPQPGLERRLVAIDGSVPDFDALPSGCRFHPRCPYSIEERCATDAVESVELEHGDSVRCVRYTELTLQGVAGR